MNHGERATERVFVLGLRANAALALLKLGVGWGTGSRSLLADGWHSLSDILTNGGAWLAHRFSLRPPDEDHHYGHGNAEAFSGVVLGAVLMVGGVGVIWSSWTSELQLAAGGAAWLAVGMAGVSILSNVWLAWITRLQGRKAKSQGMLALSRDNLSDALAGGLVVLGILGARAGYPWAETLAAFLIGSLIAFMGWRSFDDGMDVLMDRVPDPALREHLRSAAASVDGVRGVQKVRIHPLGSSYRVDVEISVDGALTVVQGHRIAHEVEAALRASEPSVEGVDVHVNPAAGVEAAGPAGGPEPR